MALKTPDATACRACVLKSMYRGIATADKMPRMIMTIINSMSVNPLEFFNKVTCSYKETGGLRPHSRLSYQLFANCPDVVLEGAV